MRDALNIAPHAPRHTVAGWLTLSIGLLAAGVGAWLLAMGMLSLQRAHEMQERVALGLRAQAQSQRAARQRQTEPAVLAQLKAQQRVQQVLRTSWAGLFDALESAAYVVRGGVSILSLMPSKSQGESTQVNLTALAANAPIMLEYLRALRHDHHLQRVELASQQPDDNAGPGVIRFRLSVEWNAQEIPESVMARSDAPLRAMDPPPGKLAPVSASVKATP